MYRSAWSGKYTNSKPVSSCRTHWNLHQPEEHFSGSLHNCNRISRGAWIRSWLMVAKHQQGTKIGLSGKDSIFIPLCAGSYDLTMLSGGLEMRNKPRRFTAQGWDLNRLLTRSHLLQFFLYFSEEKNSWNWLKM